MKISVGVKIATIIVVLLVLVGAASWINARSAHRVQGLIKEVDTVYVPAYSAMARTNLRLVEEGLLVRRLLLAQLTAIEAGSSQDELKQAIAAKARLGLETLAEARGLVQQAASDPVVAEDRPELARLDTMLDFLGQRQAEYEAAVVALQKAIEQGTSAAGATTEAKLAEISEEMKRLDLERTALNDQAEAARMKMRELLDHASNLAIHEQDVSVKVGLVLLGLALSLGSLTGGAIIIGLLRPLKRLLKGTAQVQAGNLDTEVLVTSRDELGELTTGFNNMVRELRAKARIRETFGRYVDPRIIEDLIDKPNEFGAVGERREMSILFSDMRGFTDLSEGMTPDAMVKVINRYLAQMSEPIQAHRGIIDKYLGDGIMAFWGPPFCDAEEHAALACRAGIGELVALPAFRTELPELTGIRRGLPEIDMRIGIATGEVVVGNIGSSVFMNYTVMGDAVNLAARLEGASKLYGTRFLVCERTAALAEGAILFREVDRLRVEGRKEPVQAFEVLGVADAVPEAVREMSAHFASGLAAYRNGAWTDAEQAFTAALGSMPGDNPSQVFLLRLQHLQADPPATDWDGIWPPRPA